MEKDQNNFAYEILQDYKRSSKVKDIIIFVLLGIIVLFVGGLIYFITNYDFSYEGTYAETTTGNACVGDSCNNGDTNGEGIR